MIFFFTKNPNLKQSPFLCVGVGGGRRRGLWARVSVLFYKDRKSKKKNFGWGSMRGLLARVSAFFSKESKSKKKYSGGGGGEAGVGEFFFGGGDGAGLQ